MARLPVPGSDQNVWGDVLNKFLKVEHNIDGTLKRSALIVGAQQISAKGQVDGYASLDGNGRIPAAQLADATSGAKGAVQLAGDLGGTATSPAVRNMAQVFNVKDYGAAGDGTTDDSAALQNTIDAAATSGGIVHMPVGTYVLDPGANIQVQSGVHIQGAGTGTILKVKDDTDTLNNLIKVESKQNVVIANLQLDGNRANQSSNESVATHYGVYIAGSSNCRVLNVWAHDFAGVGIHVYDSEGVVVESCTAWNNRYHGFESEQTRNCIFTANRSYGNDRHGIFVSPGEIGGSGAIGNIILGNSFENNGQYGISLGIAAGNGGSVGLTRDNLITNNAVRSNSHYGISLFQVDDCAVSNNIVTENGYFGIYLYKAQRNQLTNNRLHNNSAAAHGAYDEILLEGASDGTPSKDNIVAHNFIYINGSSKARWAISEATANDGSNRIADNIVPNAGTMGKVRIVHADTSLDSFDLTTNQSTAGLKTFADGMAIGANASLPGGTMGLDAPFGNAAFRMFSDVGNLQYVAPNGNADWYMGGNNTLSVTSQKVIAWNRLRLAVGNSPVSATDGGEAGDIAWDSNYFYVCVAASTWKRMALSSW